MRAPAPSMLKKTALVLAVSLPALLLLAVAVAWLLLRNSLPTLDGASSDSSLNGEVTIERDAAGIPTITGSSENDVAYGLGFAHGQDRFFQMDLARRLAAGELSELFGRVAIEQDQRTRPMRFREIASQALAEASPTERAWAQAYTRGVNAGLRSLVARPWEYFLLRVRPAAWRDADTVLAVQAMWWQLQHEDIAREQARLAVQARLRALTAAAAGTAADSSAADRLLEFLYPRGTEWDAPNFATLLEQQRADADSSALQSPAVPGPEQLDLRKLRGVSESASPALAGHGLIDDAIAAAFPGSNNWAVAGARTRSGVALIANDMHLGLGVPAVWYRARMIVRGPQSPRHDWNGVTLPGGPALVAGSNGQIAWGFTNSYGDWLDLTTVSCDPARQLYLTDAGPRRFLSSQQRIRVAGDSDVLLEVRDTPLGVLIDQDESSRSCTLLRWLAREPGATNLRILELMRAATTSEALQLAPSIGMPQQNLVVGDRAGQIGWTIIGRMPADPLGPRAPSPVAWRDASAQPRIENPQLGLLWSANARAVDGEAETAIGGDEAATGAGYDRGARALQIRDALRGLANPASERDMLALQLDTRALFLERWRALILGVLDEEAVKNKAWRLELKRLVESWEGQASVDAVGYRFVREFRDRTERKVWNMIVAALAVPQAADRPSPQFEGALWRLVTEQPEHMLGAGHRSWRELLLQTLDETRAGLIERCGRIESCRWGARAPVAMRHPLSKALPWLSGALDMPRRELAGDHDMPRVQDGNFGASERFAVSPGRESEGYLQLPGGQSGHPLSPFYRSMFADWADGVPSSFLPGPTQHRFTIRP